VVQGAEHPRLYRNSLRLGEIHWVAGAPPALPLRCAAKTRYRQPDQDCELSALPSGGYQVRFDQPQRAVTPGQSTVLYLGERCLGGGAIEEAWNQ
jgi:tRNA-specific 2-thiouridylase